MYFPSSHSRYPITPLRQLYLSRNIGMGSAMYLLLAQFPHQVSRKFRLQEPWRYFYSGHQLQPTSGIKTTNHHPLRRQLLNDKFIPTITLIFYTDQCRSVQTFTGLLSSYVEHPSPFNRHMRGRLKGSNHCHLEVATS